MERLPEILKILSNTKGYVSIQDLAQEFHVTARTIRNDIAALEEMLEKKQIRLKRQRNQGIALDRNGLEEKKLLEVMSGSGEEKNFYSAQERENIILESLLMEKEPMTQRKLEELTLSSKASVAKNLAACEAWLGKWQITVNKRSRRGINLVYREYQWRLAVTDHIMDYVGRMDFRQLYDNLFHSANVQISLSINKFIATFIHDINTTYIVNFIRRYESNNKIRFTDEARIAVFFYVCIAITRVKEGRVLSQDDFALNRFFHEGRIAQWIDDNLAFLNKGLTEALSRFELEAILVFLLTQRKTSEGTEVQQDFLLEDEKFHQQTRRIARNFIRRAEDYLNVDLSSDDILFENLLLHIRPTVFRLLFGIRLSNPIKEDIMGKYPAIFAACKEASKEITQETHTHIDDNEISYLALHIGASVEKIRKKKFFGIYKVIVVCPGGKGTSSILYYRLLNSIPNIQIERICSVGELEQINKEEIDLMISTVPIYMGESTNVIQVNPLLKEEDIAKIRRAIKRLNLIQNNNGALVVEDMMWIISNYATIRDYDGLYRTLDGYFNQPAVHKKENQESLKAFLKPSLIKTQAWAKDWRDAFYQAGSLLYQEGMIEKRYIDCMIANAEKYGTYMMISPKVALAHAGTGDGARKTGFSFVTLKEPVSFRFQEEEQPIQFVICLSAEENMSHLTALGELIDLVCSEETLEAMLAIRTPEQLLRFMAENSEK